MDDPEGAGEEPLRLALREAGGKSFQQGEEHVQRTGGRQLWACLWRKEGLWS